MKGRLICAFLFSHALLFATAQQNDISFRSDTVLGTYTDKNKNEYVIGRSFTRFFCYQPQTSSLRGLFRISDTEWFSGSSLLIDSPIVETYHFSNGKLVVQSGANKIEAVKSPAYKDVQVSFKSDGLRLKGTLLLPSINKKCPAVVMVHGSGEQMRHGYASYIRIIADHLAKNGIAVLTYDKRGCGESAGDFKTASFRELAQDALAGVEFLKTQSKIDIKNIGLGGSSQAGWIMAKATEINGSIPFVFCISGGGMGFTAARQNAYNLSTELSAASFNERLMDSVMLALELMYKYVRSGSKKDAAALDSLNAKLINNKEVADYLPPSSLQMNPSKKDQWFYALEIDYNPLTAWSKYNGKLLAIFGELDASTPVSEIIPLLKEARKQKPANTSITLYPGASHLILRAFKKTDEELPLLKEVEPLFLPQLTNWLLDVTNLESSEISAVKKIERKWLDMYEKNEYTGMDTLLHRNFLITYSNGLSHTKQQLLKNGFDNPVPKGYRIYTVHSKAELQPGKVILKGIVITEYPKEGKLIKKQEYYTDTYIKEKNNYKVLASKLLLKKDVSNF
jgi:dienelactone hydrolase